MLKTEGNEKLRRIHSLPISVDVGVMQPLNMVCTKESGEMVIHDTFRYCSRVMHYSLGHTNIETTLVHATEKTAEQSVEIFEKAVNPTLLTK